MTKKIALFTFIVLLTGLILIGASCDEDKNGKEKETGAKTETTEERRGGSCNAIEQESTCTDYVGSYWSESYCSAKGVIYSEGPCPPSSVGGCKTNSGTEKERILWHYSYGGDPKDSDNSELVAAIRQSCLLLNERGLNAQWVGATK